MSASAYHPPMKRILCAILAALATTVVLSAPASADDKICTVACSGRQSNSYQDWLNCMQECYQDGGR